MRILPNILLVACLGLTALLGLMCSGISPFAHPGIAANEAVIAHLMLMLLRWSALAVALLPCALLRPLRRPAIPAWVQAVIVLAAHVVVGATSLMVFMTWLQDAPHRSRGANAGFAAVYFGLSLGAAAVTAAWWNRRPSPQFHAPSNEPGGTR